MKSARYGCRLAKRARYGWRLIVALVGGALCASGAQAAPTAAEIWHRVTMLQANVQDYTASVRITPQIPEQDNTPREARVYVKRPDKVKIDSDSIVFIPREALIPGAISQHVTEETNLTLMGRTIENGRVLYGLKAIPKKNGNGMRFRIWVWGDNWTIKRTELWAGDQCVLSAEWWFIPVQGQYWMPYWIVCSFATGKLASGIGGGAITVQFWDYKVNSGLADSLFPASTGRRHGHP